PSGPEPAELRRSLLESRARRRAYDGAPPGIPHAIDEQSTASCLACHERGARIGDRLAPAMSHGPRPSCTQCHAPVHAVDSLPSNGFVGLPSPGPGRRAWPGAPPTVPHAVDLRGKCESCHGPTGLAGIRTPHPGRRSCTQCHVPELGGPARWGPDRVTRRPRTPRPRRRRRQATPELR
ncbi:MAG: hypothetical protein FJ104_12935, partial [Deltaproteobacteria bacterium]|nr:hypothetical protein [Deltaproteobacteria bacterium]